MDIQTRPSLKSFLERIIPARYRLIRYTLYQKLKYYPNLMGSPGRGVECPFCYWQFRKVLPGGFDYPVLVEKQVIGAGPRLNAICPRCNSNARERLIYLYVKHRTTLLSETVRILHVAPEPELQRVFLRCALLQYFSADLEPIPNAILALKMDLMRMPFPVNTFDVIICSHVLEHIVDDQQGMRELFRVLKVGGWAILQAPIALSLQTTYENPALTNEQDRIREFGQRDHLRLYALDYLDRLKCAGFTVRIFSRAKSLARSCVEDMRLMKSRIFIFVQKPLKG